jgi:hypothetical protein
MAHEVQNELMCWYIHDGLVFDEVDVWENWVGKAKQDE